MKIIKSCINIKVDFRAKSITGDKESCFVMIEITSSRGQSNPKCSLSNNSFKFVQEWEELQGEIDQYTLIARDFNTPLSKIEREEERKSVWIQMT